jgi:hypothetical protein
MSRHHRHYSRHIGFFVMAVALMADSGTLNPLECGPIEASEGQDGSQDDMLCDPGIFEYHRQMNRSDKPGGPTN